MTSYNIYFTNQYSEPGQSNDYALFCDVPEVSSDSGAITPYSNVFMTKSLARDTNWDITITKQYFAWCGTAVEEVSPGVRVSVGMAKPATLGTEDAPGSTFSMYNNNGSPAFRPKLTYTADAGAYEIDTDTDFTSNMNFVIGMAGSDDAGRMRALASIAAPRNASVNITPVTRFYVAQYSSTVGTVINTKSVSKKAAEIDFSANPGKFGAIVSQDNNGKFSVRYVSQAMFARAINSTEKTSEVGTLQYYIDQIQNLIEAKEWYACKAAWYGTVTKQEKLKILELLQQGMGSLGYHYEGGGIETELLMTLSHARPSTIVQARSDWQECCLNLPVNYRAKIADPAVNPVALDQLTQQVPAEAKAVGVQRSGEVEAGSIAAKKQIARRWLQDEGLNNVVNGI